MSKLNMDGLREDIHNMLTDRKKRKFNETIEL